jgi:hypothetical protein
MQGCTFKKSNYSRGHTSSTQNLMERISLYLAQKSEWLVYKGMKLGEILLDIEERKKKEYDFSFRSRCKMG